MRKFLFRLALALGKTVAEIEQIGSRELTEWIAYYGIDPFGNDREDLRMGIVASTMANTVARRGRALVPKDFIPEFKKPAQTGEEIVATMNQFASAHNRSRHGEYR